MPDEYPAIAARTIGRWAGDRIALIGDYAQDGDIKEIQERHGHRGLDLTIGESKIYNLCIAKEYLKEDPEDYKGGEFLVDHDDDEPFVAPQEIGSVTVFPSFMKHRVR